MMTSQLASTSQTPAQTHSLTTEYLYSNKIAEKNLYQTVYFCCKQIDFVECECAKAMA